VCAALYTIKFCVVCIDPKKKIRRDLLSFQKVIIFFFFWLVHPDCLLGLLQGECPANISQKKERHGVDVKI
jgi:hypothetical protein